MNLYNYVNDIDYKLFSLTENQPLNKKEISRTYGTLTESNIWVYGVKFTKNNLSLSHNERWISLKEAQGGLTRDKKHVLDLEFFNNSLKGGLSIVPESINIKKKFNYIDHINIKPQIGFIEIDVKSLIKSLLNKD